MAASRTARFVALYRALEHRERRRLRLFDDPFAAAFLPPRYRLLLQAARLPAVHAWLSRYADRRAPGARPSAITRTKCIDDLVRRAVGDGVGQIVLLGAGYDCRAHRLPELARTPVFEVDTAATQATKRSVLSGRATATPVRYVPVDFLRDDLGAALTAAGWEATRPTLFVWEGEDGEKILANVRALGEPWMFGLHPDAVAGFVAGCGLTLIEDLGADEYRRRHLPAESTRGYGFYRLAVAAARPARRPKNVASAIESPLL